MGHLIGSLWREKTWKLYEGNGTQFLENGRKSEIVSIETEVHDRMTDINHVK